MSNAAVIERVDAGTVRLRDGRTVRVRPVIPADAARLVDLHARCSSESRYLRFHSAKPRLRAVEAEYLAASDGCHRVSLVATVLGEGGEERIVADARFDVTGPGVAEAAFLVEDEFQRSGLGSALIAVLAGAAHAVGLRRLTLDVLLENRAMVTVATRAGARAGRFDGRSVVFTLDVRPAADGGCGLTLPEHRHGAKETLVRPL